MAQLDLHDASADADLATLYWWRRDEARATTEQAAGLSRRLVAVVERAAAAPRSVLFPGNRLRANAANRRMPEMPARKDEFALDPHLLEAIRSERRGALLALAVGLVATAASVVAAIYAAIMHQPIALGFAIAGGAAASFALYHAARWLLLTRADAPPNFLA